MAEKNQIDVVEAQIKVTEALLKSGYRHRIFRGQDEFYEPAKNQPEAVRRRVLLLPDQVAFQVRQRIRIKQGTSLGHERCEWKTEKSVSYDKINFTKNGIEVAG